MAIGIYFSPSDMSADIYDEVMRELEAPAPPKDAATTARSRSATGCTYSTSGTPGNLRRLRPDADADPGEQGHPRRSADDRRDPQRHH